MSCLLHTGQFCRANGHDVSPLLNLQCHVCCTLDCVYTECTNFKAIGLDNISGVGVCVMACMNGIGEDEFVHRGRKRRHRHDDDMHANGPVARSQLAHMLLEMWAWGEISAYRLQQMAEAGVHDGIGHPDMRKLASLGTNGKHSGNCHRDLTRYLDKIVHMPEPVPMTIPLKMDDDNVNIVDIPLLPLHRLFAHMAQHWPLEFEARVTGPPSALQDFWNTVKPQDPKFVAWQGALQQRPEYKTKCIPLALHGDGVPVFKGKSMYIVGANSLLGTG